MINTISTYRRLFASILSIWMGLIVISGIVFMHKEVTSKGEIVTHIHPYDFTQKKKKNHHKNDNEIQFLNVVFQGNFVEDSFITFEIPFFQEFYVAHHEYIPTHFYPSIIIHHDLRGPPLFS